MRGLHSSAYSCDVLQVTHPSCSAICVSAVTVRRRGRSCGIGLREADAGSDQPEMVVRESVAVLTQLPGQRPLAQTFAPHGSVLPDHGRSAH